MGHRNRRDLKPFAEYCEPRALLSGIINVMAQNSLATLRGSAGTGFMPSSQSIAIPSNQGPQGLNLALTPTGTLTPREQRREQFVAVFKGPYTIGAGRTDTEASQVFIQGAGNSNWMNHADLQLSIVAPKDPSIGFTGVASVFDRNLNSNSELGVNISAPITAVDAAGRPNEFNNVAIDVNMSAGVFVEAYAQGSIAIRYMPSGKHTPGVLDQGTAIVIIRAQIYTTGVGFILRNSNLNP
jgi:hypothetical protein